jgi:hypothetical protein
MKLTVILLSMFLIASCAKDSNDGSPHSPQSPQALAPSSESEIHGRIAPPNAEIPPAGSNPVKLGNLVNVVVTPEQPLIGVRYSKSQKDQFDFNFNIRPSEFGVTESGHIAHIFIRLVSKRTNLPLTQWYFQSSLEREAVDPNKDLFFFQSLSSKAEAKSAATQLGDLAIQIAVQVKDGVDTGEWYWIDLGSYCSTAPQNFMELDSLSTGCN